MVNAALYSGSVKKFAGCWCVCTCFTSMLVSFSRTHRRAMVTCFNIFDKFLRDETVMGSFAVIVHNRGCYICIYEF